MSLSYFICLAESLLLGWCLVIECLCSDVVKSFVLTSVICVLTHHLPVVFCFPSHIPLPPPSPPRFAFHYNSHSQIHTGTSPLSSAHARPLHRQRSSNLSSGSQSPTTFSPSQFEYPSPNGDGYYHHPSNGHQRSLSNSNTGTHTPSNTSSSYSLDELNPPTTPGGTPLPSSVRRHTSLTQGVNTRISDRLSRTPFLPTPMPSGTSTTSAGAHSISNPNSRDGSDDETSTAIGATSGGNGLGSSGGAMARRVRSSTELPPPTSPIRGSPWSAPQNDLLVRQKSWDDEQQHRERGRDRDRGSAPLSPVLGAFGLARNAGSGGVSSSTSNQGLSMTEQQMQDAVSSRDLGLSFVWFLMMASL